MPKRIAHAWLTIGRHVDGYLLVDYLVIGADNYAAESVWIVPGTLAL